MILSDTRLSLAESIALDRLIAIARDAESDHEARLAAVAIFNIRRRCDDAAAANSSAPAEARPTQPPPPPAPPLGHSQAHAPLTPEELAQLALALPNVKPQRFLNKHSPAHWRDVLRRHQPRTTSHTPLSAATGPPGLADRAAR
ncbi:MAG: hypothetical protein ACK4WH_03130 [Phycisphaerales bacterium]